jgi:hypothetical protein
VAGVRIGGGLNVGARRELGPHVAQRCLQFIDGRPHCGRTVELARGFEFAVGYREQAIDDHLCLGTLHHFCRGSHGWCRRCLLRLRQSRAYV